MDTLIAERVGWLPCDRLILRILCRTADWRAGLEDSLKQAFGTIDVVEILPLRQSMLKRSQPTGATPRTSFARSSESGLVLAARPLTLWFLAQAFGEAGSLPSGAALYAAGVRSLCEEQNVNRRDAGLTGALSVDERVAIARRLAAATIFGNATANWTGAEESIPSPRISPSTASLARWNQRRTGSVSVTLAAVREAAGQRC